MGVLFDSFFCAFYKMKALFMNDVWFQLISSFIIGGITAILADWRGRSSVTWFCIGTFFGPFGLLALLIMPKNPTDVSDSDSSKNTLPSGSYPQSQNKSDTNKTKIEKENAETEKEGGLSSAQEKQTSSLWFYVDHITRQAKGPIDVHELEKLWKKGLIQNTTLVWSKNLKEWTEIQFVDVFRKLQTVDSPTPNQ